MFDDPAFPTLGIRAKKDEKKDILKMFFDKDQLIHCKEFDGVVKNKGMNCTDNDKIFLKINALKGSDIEYEVLVPDCLKAAGKGKPTGLFSDRPF